MRWLSALGVALILIMAGCGGDDGQEVTGDGSVDSGPQEEVSQDAEPVEPDPDVPDAGPGDASQDIGPEGDGTDGGSLDAVDADGPSTDVEEDASDAGWGQPCVEHWDCMLDLLCVDYECHGIGDGVGQPCSGDADCVEGLYCVDNQCGEKVAACGDGILDEGEECDDGLSNSDILPNTCRENCQLPSCGDGVTDTGEGCDDANSDETDGCSVICIANLVYDKPQVGELVVTELMINPASSFDPFGEWVEIYNKTDKTLSLVGCQIHDQGTDVIVPGEDTGYQLIEPGQHLVLGFSGDLDKNGGVAVDLVYGTMLLDNLVDEVIISCPAGVVDEVAYGSVLFPIISGASMALDGGSVDATVNDLPFSWCSATQPFGAGDTGTPGEANPSCPEADITVDLCELAPPAEVTHILGDPASVTVHITEAGLTDQSDGVDTVAALWVQVGFGAPGSDPSSDGWTWNQAAAVEGWLDTAGIDAHQGPVSPSAPGTSDAAARVSLDAGETWTHCDLSPGSTDGYQPASALQVTTIEDPCLSVVCDDPPSSECSSDGITALLFDAQDAVCTLLDWEAACTYPPQSEDCGYVGSVCEGAGECVGGVAAPPVQAEVVINELMLQPTKVSAGVGVWIELYNPGQAPLDLTGCFVGYADGAAVVIDAPLLIAAGGYRILSPTTSESGNGGVPADYAYGNALTLILAPATLQLSCGGALIDEIAYSPITWPIVTGSSLSLSPYHGSGVGNDSPSAWCSGQTPYGEGDLGTPGAPNDPCAGDEEPLDDCRIEGPATVETLAGTALSVGGRVVEAGITDQTPQTDLDQSLLVQAGWGPEGEAPDDPSWSWTAAKPDPGWDAGEAGASPLEDRWEAVLMAPAAGTYAVLVRASADGGHTWTACDLDGAANGLDLDQAVSLVTSPSSCDPSPCVDPPPSDCDGTAVQDWHAPAFCSVVEDTTECQWTPTTVLDCADEGAECEAGVCVNYPANPEPATMVISEVLIVPADGEVGEWVELTYVGASQITLDGCSLESGPGQTWDIVTDTPLEALVAPEGVVVAARSPDIGGDEAPDLVYGDALSFGNSSDEIRLLCAGVEIDAIAWDQTTGWVIPVHGTLSLSGNRVDAAQNDLIQPWCPGPLEEGAPPGTPGELNPLCASLDGVVEFCLYEGPASLDLEHGGSAEATMRLLDEGTTDATTGADPAPGITAEVGYGPPDTVPGPDWIWFGATADPEWDDLEAPGEDRWRATLTGAQSGTWDVAARATADGGETWLLCDTNGSGDGYDPTDSGILTVGASACDPNPCIAPPASSCLDELLQVPVGPGACTEDEDGGPSCEYEAIAFDCAAYDGCDAGACIAPPASPSAAGHLVVTEVHRDSFLGPPDLGEWVEIYNASDSPWDVRGCALGDLGGDSWTITNPVPVVVEEGGYLVIAAASDLGIDATDGADLVWSGLSLDNLFDEMIITCGGTEIDRVAWSPGWPGEEGVAMQLTSSMTSGALNDDVDAWCPAQSAIGDSDELGTPGEPNDVCPD